MKILRKLFAKKSSEEEKVIDSKEQPAKRKANKAALNSNRKS